MTTLSSQAAGSVERLKVFTPLGIRFWDPALDVQISDDLSVVASPAAGRKATPAVRTASGIYAFHGLPGLHDLEYLVDEQILNTSPPFARRFIVQVSDNQRRLLPVTFRVDLPFTGIFPTDAINGSVETRPPGFYLFSASTRPTLPTLAVVRVQLVERVDPVTERAAAHAVIEIQAPGNRTWYGLADERGRVAILFPYPTFTTTSSGNAGLSPPVIDRRQHWELGIRVRYAPATLSIAPGSALPDLRSILNQPLGVIWSSRTTTMGQPVNHMSANLTFGEELVLRTDSESTLLIGPAILSP
jgi:hypothetical protein